MLISNEQDYNNFELREKNESENFFRRGFAVIWLRYCRYGVKNHPINQSIEENVIKIQISEKLLVL